jgi:hypothetical protein
MVFSMIKLSHYPLMKHLRIGVGRGMQRFTVLGLYTAKDDHCDAMVLVIALAKMTVLPAKRMEKFAPVFKNKGRLREAFDAELTIFIPQ